MAMWYKTMQFVHAYGEQSSRYSSGWNPHWINGGGWEKRVSLI